MRGSLSMVNKDCCGQSLLYSCLQYGYYLLPQMERLTPDPPVSYLFLDSLSLPPLSIAGPLKTTRASRTVDAPVSSPSSPFLRLAKAVSRQAHSRHPHTHTHTHTLITHPGRPLHPAALIPSQTRPSIRPSNQGRPLPRSCDVPFARKAAASWHTSDHPRAKVEAPLACIDRLHHPSTRLGSTRLVHT
ncbi:hypothetical protein LX32DRAFT_108906 [Colletotrichum zoysiae]|uniref:Uncharacterized protein n=1 Tax=Colletotrichum zoysiae TaxID=1216348 RepID=A0AAD9H8R3_9PEZI|nr:hypothetical protein LX32DRAFT_108906 [Colletotrichum zoysiae]